MAYSTVSVNTMFALWACCGALFAAGHRFLQTRGEKKVEEKIANQHTGLHSYAVYTPHNFTYADGGRRESYGVTRLQWHQLDQRHRDTLSHRDESTGELEISTVAFNSLT